MLKGIKVDVAGLKSIEREPQNFCEENVCVIGKSLLVVQGLELLRDRHVRDLAGYSGLDRDYPGAD